MTNLDRAIFLDGNSTTPVDPRVANSICALYRRTMGNPSSMHRFGWRAKNLLEQARKNVATFLGSQDEEVFFSASVTIALNVAIQGILMRDSATYKRVAASRIEHSSVLSLIRNARYRWGFEWVELEIDKYGSIIPSSVERAVNKGVDIVIASHGNGEIGSLNDLREILAIANRNAPVVVDASQTAAYLDLAVASPADCLIMSGHKLYGPRGIAALRKRRGVDLTPILFGAGQEGGLFPGTEDVPAAVALGIAARLAEKEREKRREHVSRLTQSFKSMLCSRVPGLEINGHPTQRIPGNLSITVPGVPAELLIRQLPNIAFSMASACTGEKESHVLKALGLKRARAASTFRIGIHAFNTHEEIERAGRDIIAAILRHSRHR